MSENNEVRLKNKKQRSSFNILTEKTRSDNTRQVKIIKAILKIIEGNNKNKLLMLSGLFHLYRKLGYNLRSLYNIINFKYKEEPTQNYIDVAIYFDFLPLSFNFN